MVIFSRLLPYLIVFSYRHAVSQFTLLANTRKGNKPDFHGAAGGDQARALYECFVADLREQYEKEAVKDGVFQAMMDVALVNDGPVCEQRLEYIFQI